MKVIDEESKFTILEGDAHERLNDIPTGAVDCIFTSPDPITNLYGLNKTARILGKAYRVVKPNGSMFLHMEDYFDEDGSLTEYCSTVANLLHFYEWITRGRMIWYMRQKGHPNIILINKDYELADRNRFRLDYSYIYHFTKARYGYYFDNEGLGAFTNSSIFEEEYKNPDILEKRTGFSENLIALCLTLGCRPGGTVLDLFAGYGSTGVVALKLGYKFIGIDKDANRVQMINENLKNVK